MAVNADDLNSSIKYSLFPLQDYPEGGMTNPIGDSHRDHPKFLVNTKDDFLQSVQELSGEANTQNQNLVASDKKDDLYRARMFIWGGLAVTLTTLMFVAPSTGEIGLDAARADSSHSNQLTGARSSVFEKSDEDVSFKVTADDCITTLAWTVVEEKNVLRYEVLQRPESGEWRMVARVDASKTTGLVSEYSLDLMDEPSSHYRIKRVSTDGSTQLFPAVYCSVDCIPMELSISSDKGSKGGFELEVICWSDLKASLEVEGMEGEILHTQSLDLVQGLNLVKVHIADLPSGTYHVKILSQEREVIEAVDWSND